MTKKTKVSKSEAKHVGKVMSRFHKGKLKTSAGVKVKKPEQAAAIGYSEVRAKRKKKG